MAIEGIGSASAPNFNIHFGSFSKAKSSKSTSDIRNEINLIQREIIKLRKALEEIHNPLRMRRVTQFQPAQFASAASVTSLDMNNAAATVLLSTEEVNSIDTSYSPFEPVWVGSTAQATIGGTYDGSGGTGTLTFKSDRTGTHGADDLKIKVYNTDDSFIQDINIDKDDPIGTQYTLLNGLTLTLGDGDLLQNETFTVDVDATVPTSFTPSAPAWDVSTAQASISGIYDGSNGTNTLTFIADDTGTHGVDDLRVKVYDKDNNLLEQFDVDKGDPLNTPYALSNGLSVTLGAGDLLKGTEFTLDVFEAESMDLIGVQPAWGGLGTSDAQATIDGTYDGSNGAGTLMFKVDREGTHGADDLKIKVYAPDDSFIEDLNIDKNDPLDTQYTLSNGLTLTLGTGDLVKLDTFTLDVTDSPPSSFTGYEPAWNGLFSDAQATLDGTYDGSNGAGTFTFSVDRGGTHGSNDLKIKVYDPEGSFLQDVNISKNDPLNQQYTLQNGIILTLGAGELLKNDTFSITFEETIGSAVDPTNPFNGIGNDNPNFEPGFNVIAGSFQVNGVTIDVNADDSINSVLSQITNSAAGVIATYNSTTEKVVLTQKSLGSSHDIVLENDTSGFLAASKLDAAVPMYGIDSDADDIMSNVAQFSSVTNGTISINGTDIAIDVTADSLNDVIARINASGAGVTATLNESTNRVNIVATDITEPLVLSSGGTGFFPALGIIDNTYDPVSRRGEQGETAKLRMTRARAEKVADSIMEAAEAFNKLFDDKTIKSEKDSLIETYREKLRTAVSEAFDSESSNLRTKFGVEFDFNTSLRNVFDYSSLDRLTLIRQLTTDGSPVNDLFFAGEIRENDGLLEKLLKSSEFIESDLEELLGPKGIFVDQKV